MKLARCLGLLLFFSLVLFTVLKLENQITRNEENFEDSLMTAFQLVKEMQFKANRDYQMQNWFGRFRQELSANNDSFFKNPRVPAYITANLPPHTLAVAKSDKNNKLIQFANLSGNFTERLAGYFVDLAGEFKEEFSDFGLKKEKKEVLKICDQLMQEFLDAPMARVNMIMLRATRYSVFTSEHRSIWFFWDRFLDDKGENIYIFSRIDVTGIDEKFSFRSYLRSLPDSPLLCGYYDVGENSFIAEMKFKKILDLKAHQTIARECRKIYRDRTSSTDYLETVTKLPLKRHLAVIGRFIGDPGLFPVVVLPEKSALSSRKVTSLPSFILVCCLVLFVVNVSVFGRGPEMKVDTVLIMAIIFVILMPFILGRSVFKLIMRESYEKERLKIERDLHQSLSGIDNSYKTAQSNLKERLSNLFKNPELMEKIRKDEETKDQEIIEKSVVLDIAHKVFEKVSEGFDFIPLKYRIINAIIISGPNDYLRYFNKYRGPKLFSKETLHSHESMLIILMLIRDQLFRFIDSSEFESQLLQAHETEKNNQKQILMKEEAATRLKSSLGPDKYHEIMYKNASIAGLRSSFGEAFVVNFPVYYQGKIRYFVSTAWDEFAFCPTFLRRAFILRRKNDEAEIAANSSELLQRFDPSRFILRKRMVLMAYDGFRFDNFSSEEQEPQTLSNLVKNTHRSKLLLRQETTGESASIFQVYPCRNISVYLIGAQQDITHLKRIENIRSIMFLGGVVLFLLFALAAAKNLSSSFTSPLQHLLWGLQRVEQNDYSVRLKDTREDEFGSISRAFNFMTRRLREKDTLGKFVSESVKKLAADPQLLKKAIEGAEEDVTIVFAGLEGFSRLALEENEVQVQKHLEFSLKRFFSLAAELGGEVDKVIGEKILIVFHHNRIGKERSVAAAVELARRILSEFSGNESLKPVFGINMGRVISGIIGAAEVKMDLTIIGDPVNVAARLCSLAESTNCPVVVSGQIKESLDSGLVTEKIDIARVKGKRQEVDVYKLSI
ncbi:MAG: adenylate/guanylate cyclase domain-containing protein [Candidatus Rifleibacteriota bacterium]